MFVSFPLLLNIPLAVFQQQKIFYILVGFIKNLSSNSIWLISTYKVELPWHATCHSYDVIELVSKQITRHHRIFIPVSSDAKTMKIDQEMQDL